MTDAQLKINEIELFGERRTLKPLVGRRARLMVPKLLEFLTRALAAIGSIGIDPKEIVQQIREIGQSEVTVQDVMPLLPTIYKITRYLTKFFADQWEEFDTEILPFLLQVDQERLEEEGGIVEVYVALFRAIRFYALHSLTPEQREAFNAVMRNIPKNSLQGEETTPSPSIVKSNSSADTGTSPIPT